MHRSSERARPASGMESRISGASAVRKHESAKAAQAGSRLVAEPRADKKEEGPLQQRALSEMIPLLRHNGNDDKIIAYFHDHSKSNDHIAKNSLFLIESEAL